MIGICSVDLYDDMSYPLTPKQKQVLDAIRSYSQRKGYMPTIRDLCRTTGLAVGTIADHLTLLKRKEWLDSDGTARGIRLSENAAAASEAVAVPIVGIIAAGKPIEAIEISDNSLVLSRRVTKSGSYALRVKGDSMIGDHILDGDVVVISPQPSVQNGEIAVALLEDGTATLKRIYRESNRIRLQPANSKMKPLFTKKLTIQGKVTSVVRVDRQ